jgi:predicted nuclease of predicted toxin-antitoxin system
MFLANENFPAPSTHILRNKGYNITSFQEVAPGILDEDVINRALALNLIILTFDSDYGELIFKYAIENPPAFVFFREKGNTPAFAAHALLHLLENTPITFSGAFTVIEGKSVRQRLYKKPPLPSSLPINENDK